MASFVGKDALDLGELVYMTNKAQAICVLLSEDDLVPIQVQQKYKEANELLQQALRIAIKR